MGRVEGLGAGDAHLAVVFAAAGRAAAELRRGVRLAVRVFVERAAVRGSVQVGALARQEAHRLASRLERRAHLLEAGSTFAGRGAAVFVLGAQMRAVSIGHAVEALGLALERTGLEGRITLGGRATRLPGGFGSARRRRRSRRRIVVAAGDRSERDERSDREAETRSAKRCSS